MQLGFDVATREGVAAAPDVVKNAETQEKWHPESHIAVVPKEERSTVFYVRMTGVDEISQFGKPIVTVKPPIFKPRLVRIVFFFLDFFVFRFWFDFVSSL